MEKRRILPQEILKLIACITMLIDHVGASLFPNELWIRMIGRLAFPRDGVIYKPCNADFLLSTSVVFSYFKSNTVYCNF